MESPWANDGRTLGVDEGRTLDKNSRCSGLHGADLEEARLEKVGFDHSDRGDMNLEGTILTRDALRRTRSWLGVRWNAAILDGVHLPLLDERDRRWSHHGPGARDIRRCEVADGVLRETPDNQGNHSAAGILCERGTDMKRLRGDTVDRPWLTGLWSNRGPLARPARLKAVFMGIMVGCAAAIERPELGGMKREGSGEDSARSPAVTEALLGVYTSALVVLIYRRRMVR